MDFLTRNRTQLLIAFALSVVGALVNQLIYWSTDIADELPGQRTPIAFVKSLRGNLSRKSENSNAWRPLLDGAVIYPGDTIRTGSSSFVNVQFQESDRALELEESTMIVLQKSEQAISLTLVDGRLFVTPEVSGKIGPKLIATSGKKRIELNGQAQQLLKEQDGEAQLTVEDAVAVNKVQNLLKASEPTPDQVVYRMPGQGRKVAFRWKAVEGTVELWTGFSRGALKRLTEFSSRDGETAAALPAGQVFWQLRLIGKDKKLLASTSPERIEIREIGAPQILYPAHGAVIRFKGADHSLEARWFKPPEFDRVQVQLLSKEGGEVFLDQEIHGADSVRVPSLSAGEYVLRTRVFLPGQADSFATTQSIFSVTEKAKTRVNIEWDPRFSLNQEYLGEVPELKAGWKTPESAKVNTWRLSIVPEGRDIASVDPEIVQSTSVTRSLKEPGRYNLRVEALDEESERIGISQVRSVIVRPLPLLPRVRLSGQTSPLEASADGSVKLTWDKIESALIYRLVMATAAGQVVLSEDLRETEFSVTDLMPGRYTVSIVGVDGHGRSGDKGQPFTVIVPEQAQLASPKLKKVRVE